MSRTNRNARHIEQGCYIKWVKTSLANNAVRAVEVRGRVLNVAGDVARVMHRGEIVDVPLDRVCEVIV